MGGRRAFATRAVNVARRGTLLAGWLLELDEPAYTLPVPNSAALPPCPAGGVHRRLPGGYLPRAPGGASWRPRGAGHPAAQARRGHPRHGAHACEAGVVEATASALGRCQAGGALCAHKKGGGDFRHLLARRPLLVCVSAARDSAWLHRTGAQAFETADRAGTTWQACWTRHACTGWLAGCTALCFSPRAPPPPPPPLCRSSKRIGMKTGWSSQPGRPPARTAARHHRPRPALR